MRGGAEERADMLVPAREGAPCRVEEVIAVEAEEGVGEPAILPRVMTPFFPVG